MKNRNWIENFIHALILLFYIMLTNNLLNNLYEKSQITYNILPYHILYIVIFIIFGFLVGSLSFFHEIKKPGIWKINLFKLIFLGIPTAYFVLCLLITYFNINWLSFITNMYLVVSVSSNMCSVICLLLGYTLITSFYKKK